VCSVVQPVGKRSSCVCGTVCGVYHPCGKFVCGVWSRRSVGGGQVNVCGPGVLMCSPTKCNRKCPCVYVWGPVERYVPKVGDVNCGNLGPGNCVWDCLCGVRPGGVWGPAGGSPPMCVASEPTVRVELGKSVCVGCVCNVRLWAVQNRKEPTVGWGKPTSNVQMAQPM